MEVRVCRNCRRLFKYIYGPELCSECTKLIKTENNIQADRNKQDIPMGIMQKDNRNYEAAQLPHGIKPLVKDEELKYQQVKDYILAHPAASVAEISEVNDISPVKLFDWIREERLEFSEDAEFAWFTCQGCGTKIKSGRLCNRCKMIK